MLEVTILRAQGDARIPASFQFENDELQAFFDALTVDDTVQLVSLRSMTSPLVLTGGPGSTATPMRHDPKPAAPRESGTLRQPVGINTPIQEQARSAKADVDKAKAQTLADANRAAAEAKARAEKK